jgi:hypothetical protein
MRLDARVAGFGTHSQPKTLNRRLAAENPKTNGHRLVIRDVESENSEDYTHQNRASSIDIPALKQ